jgi:ORF6N domain
MAQNKQTAIIPDEQVISRIYIIRGQKVMFDRDLAALYGVRPIRLREQMKRNPERFPENFMFQLSEEEVDEMVSQFAIPSRKYPRGYLPYAFTEHGVLMPANVLRSERAIKMSIRNIEIFVKMREILFTHKDILLQLEKIEQRLNSHDEQIQLIFQYLKELLNPPQPARNPIGFRTKRKIEIYTTCTFTESEGSRATNHLKLSKQVHMTKDGHGNCKRLTLFSTIKILLKKHFLVTNCANTIKKSLRNEKIFSCF